jgi:hypothetical protein
MPRHDPPPDRQMPGGNKAAPEWRRFRAMMSWMVLAAAVASGLALLYLAALGEELRLHMVIATVAGVGLSVLVGTGLMGLVFLSHRSGHDDDVTYGERDDR